MIRVANLLPIELIRRKHLKIFHNSSGISVPGTTPWPDGAPSDQCGGPPGDDGEGPLSTKHRFALVDSYMNSVSSILGCVCERHVPEYRLYDKLLTRFFLLPHPRPLQGQPVRIWKAVGHIKCYKLSSGERLKRPCARTVPHQRLWSVSPPLAAPPAIPHTDTRLSALHSDRWRRAAS